jgi:hypothetical protein
MNPLPQYHDLSNSLTASAREVSHRITRRWLINSGRALYSVVLLTSWACCSDLSLASECSVEGQSAYDVSPLYGAWFEADQPLVELVFSMDNRVVLRWNKVEVGRGEFFFARDELGRYEVSIYPEKKQPVSLNEQPVRIYVRQCPDGFCVRREPESAIWIRMSGWQFPPPHEILYLIRSPNQLEL